MHELEDQELLADFARTRSESAFATLVNRYLNLVYSAALRFTANPHHAEEITQAVFVILSRKAATLGRNVVLSGWLYQTARLTSFNFVKQEIRRQHREQVAYMEANSIESTASAWEHIAPLLENAMGDLCQTDRDAIVLRFFSNQSVAQVAAALDVTEAAASKRINRAVEKLRRFFNRRGVTLSTFIVTSSLAANSVQAAPAGLSTSVMNTAAKGSAISGSMLAMINGTLKLMAWLKVKTAVMAAAAVVVIADVSMREKTLTDTLCLCWGLLLCLLLPMMLSIYAPSDRAAKIDCMKIVWFGQGVLTVAGLALLASSPAAVPAAVIASVIYLGCALVLWRKLNSTRAVGKSVSQ